jgi:hypothetical protein
MLEVHSGSMIRTYSRPIALRSQNQAQSRVLLLVGICGMSLSMHMRWIMKGGSKEGEEEEFPWSK